MGTEIEKKYRVTEAAALVLGARLAACGAEARGVEFEENTLYAGPGLDERTTALRLRRVGARAWLTYKQRSPTTAGIKRQREDETEVGDADALADILDALGYRPALVYEKRRATWLYGGAEVLVDELPFGWFVEIEGSEEAINEVEQRLGLDAAEVEHEHYPGLTRRFGVARGTLVEARFPITAAPPQV
ncbi:MAG TPA: class IV adenylate cyclase [Pyrinomonadaceae bacterium]|jgi:adenylate cyclase class 2